MKPRPIALSVIIAVTTLVAAVTTQSSAQVGVSGPTLPSSINPTNLSANFPFCSWWVETSTQKSNVLYPDTSAAYWTTPFLLDPATSVQLSGTFTNGRYYSIQVYDQSGQPASQVYTSSTGATGTPTADNYITDYDITPNAGSANPFASGVYPSTAQTYNVTISPTQGTATNWIPMPAAPSSATTTNPGFGFIMFRAYLPQNPPASNLTAAPNDDPVTDPPFTALSTVLPTVSIIKGTATTTLSTCPALQGSQLMQNTTAGIALAKALAGDVTLKDNDPCYKVEKSGKTCVERTEFFRTSSGQTPFPNGDSAYVAAKYVLPPGQALVVTARIPTTPWDISGGTGVSPWPTKDEQMRYVSFCNYIHRPPYPVVENSGQWGCANDVEIRNAMNSNGETVTVVTRDIDKPTQIKNLGTPGDGFIWLPASRTEADAEMMFAVRNMLASSTFSQSATNIPTSKELNANAAAVVMGSYYPMAVLCDVKLLEKLGPLKCATVHRTLLKCSNISGFNATPTGTLQRDGSIRATVKTDDRAIAKAVVACAKALNAYLVKSGKDGKRGTHAGLTHVAGCLVGAETDCRGMALQRADFRRAVMTKATLQWADLSGAGLVEAQLERAQAHNAKLNGANLQSVQAQQAQFQQAELNAANLASAVLTRANLTGADLSKANLQGANLSKANLSNADLSGANLTGANFDGANLTGANLTGANISGVVADKISSGGGSGGGVASGGGGSSGGVASGGGGVANTGVASAVGATMPDGSRCNGSLASCLSK